MCGDTNIGGVDFVKRMMDFCQYEYRVKSGEIISENVQALECLRI